MIILGWLWPILQQGKTGPLGFWMGKDEKVHFSVAIIVFDMEMQPATARMNVKGQGHSMTLAKGHLDWIFLSPFS